MPPRARHRTSLDPSDLYVLAPFQGLTITRKLQPNGLHPSLIDYVNFANICQQNRGAYTIGHAVYTIEGQPRPWSEQSDGPALQTLAILQAFPQLDAPTQATARTVIGANIDYLLGPARGSSLPVYQSPTTNLWEEQKGNSFFARAVQLRCFQEIT